LLALLAVILLAAGPSAAANAGSVPPHGQLKKERRAMLAKPQLALAVGSGIEVGEWQSHGKWVKAEPSTGVELLPANLQQIAADYIIKVWHHVWCRQGPGIWLGDSSSLAAGVLPCR
jgi:hypothetical protein